MENSEWVKKVILWDVDVARLLGCDYDHSILRTPAKTGKQVGFGDIGSKTTDCCGVFYRRSDLHGNRGSALFGGSGLGFWFKVECRRISRMRF